MDITKTDARPLPVAELVPNEGQIPGVPANPRQINESEYAKLLASLRKDNLTGIMPLKVVRYNNEWIVLGGNMRLRALQELGVEDVPCIVVPHTTDTDTLKKIVITDNSTFGDWDMDALANEWDANELKDWGVDIPDPQAGLPDELMGLDLNPDELAELQGDDKTETERIIIVFKGDEREKLCALLGLTAIEKVVYRFEGDSLC